MQILLATTNEGKVRELKKLLEGLDVQILSLKDMASKFEVEEDRGTFVENALKKAKEYSLYYNLPAIADDSGLVIDALDGMPGVYSARFYDLEVGGKVEDSSKTADQKNIEKVLRLMEGVKDRSAKFVSSVVFYSPEGWGLFAEGECRGRIAHQPAGDKGFGYDPIFIPEGYSVTMAQLELEEKNRISHRGKAFSKLAERLKRLLG